MKGKRKGKRRIDDDQQFKKAIKNSLANDMRLDDVGQNSQSLAEKIANKVVDQEDFVDDDEEYQRILLKVLKESELEAKSLEAIDRGENIFCVSQESSDGLYVENFEDFDVSGDDLAQD